MVATHEPVGQFPKRRGASSFVHYLWAVTCTTGVQTTLKIFTNCPEFTTTHVRPLCVGLRAPETLAVRVRHPPVTGSVFYTRQPQISESPSKTLEKRRDNVSHPDSKFQVTHKKFWGKNGIKLYEARVGPLLLVRFLWTSAAWRVFPKGVRERHKVGDPPQGRDVL